MLLFDDENASLAAAAVESLSVADRFRDWRRKSVRKTSRRSLIRCQRGDLGHRRSWPAEVPAASPRTASRRPDSNRPDRSPCSSLPDSPGCPPDAI